MAKKTPLQKRLAFTPYETPTSPPPGFYDPALDSQMRAAERGYTDLQQDSERDTERANSGLVTSSSRLNEDYNRSNERRGQDYQASLKDLLTSRTRQTQDYGTDREDRNRGYQQLGGRQTQSAVNQGVTGGGALAAAMQARQANQSREQGRADQGYNRAMEDSMGSEARLNMNAQRMDQDARSGFARRTQDLGTGYAYDANDRSMGLARGGRELGFYGQDIGAQRFFQANQSGWDADSAKPSNEFRDAQGAYRVIMKNGKKIRVRPNGRTF